MVNNRFKSIRPVARVNASVKSPQQKVVIKADLEEGQRAESEEG